MIMLKQGSSFIGGCFRGKRIEELEDYLHFGTGMHTSVVCV